MNAFPNALVGLCLLALSAYSGSSFSAHQSAVRGTAGMVSSTSALGNEAAIEVMKSGAMRSMRRSRSVLRWQLLIQKQAILVVAVLRSSGCPRVRWFL